MLNPLKSQAESGAHRPFFSCKSGILMLNPLKSQAESGAHRPFFSCKSGILKGLNGKLLLSPFGKGGRGDLAGDATGKIASILCQTDLLRRIGKIPSELLVLIATVFFSIDFKYIIIIPTLLGAVPAFVAPPAAPYFSHGMQFAKNPRTAQHPKSLHKRFFILDQMIKQNPSM